MRVLGAVLAGGASSRFGSDKAMAMLGGRVLLDHAATAIAPFVEAVVVVGRGEVDDLPAPGLGPLGGIAGALADAERRGFDSVLTIACDMVALPEGLIGMLLERAPTYCSDAPVLGHWPVGEAAALLGRLRVLAAAGSHAKTPGLSVRRWAIDIGAVAIPSPVPIANINTPADLATL